MQNRNMSLFRQKNHIPLTIVSIVACFVLLPAIGSFLMMPQVLTLLPLLVVLLLAYIGSVSAVVCAGLLVGLAFSLFGGWGALCMAMLIVPTTAATAIAFEREQPFFTAAAAGCVALFASMGVILGLLSVLAGSDVVSALTQIMRQMLDEYTWLGDLLLTMLLQMGAVVLPEGVEAAAGLAGIDAATRTQMLSSLVMALDTTLRLEIPMQMATGSIAAGIFGQALVRKGMLKRGVKVEYPVLRTWRVPKGWGRILGGTLAVLYVLLRLLPNNASTMFYVFSGVFDQVFALQGIAAMCYLLHHKGKRKFWQVIVFILGYTLLRSVAVGVGILDQCADFTHRREKLDAEENPFDPRSDRLI